MYGLYSRAASNQERPMMARIRYSVLGLLFTFCYCVRISLDLVPVSEVVVKITLTFLGGPIS